MLLFLTVRGYETIEVTDKDDITDITGGNGQLVAYRTLCASPSDPSTHFPSFSPLFYLFFTSFYVEFLRLCYFFSDRIFKNKRHPWRW